MSLVRIFSYIFVSDKTSGIARGRRGDDTTGGIGFFQTINVQVFFRSAFVGTSVCRLRVASCVFFVIIYTDTQARNVCQWGKRSTAWEQNK